MSAHTMPTHHNSMGNNIWTITESKWVEKEVIDGYEEVFVISYVYPVQRPVYKTVKTWTTTTSEPFSF